MYLFINQNWLVIVDYLLFDLNNLCLNTTLVGFQFHIFYFHKEKMVWVRVITFISHMCHRIHNASFFSNTFSFTLIFRVSKQLEIILFECYYCLLNYFSLRVNENYLFFKNIWVYQSSWMLSCWDPLFINLSFPIHIKPPHFWVVLACITGKVLKTCLCYRHPSHLGTYIHFCMIFLLSM